MQKSQNGSTKRTANKKPSILYTVISRNLRTRLVTPSPLATLFRSLKHLEIKFE